jgi:hypothetical protein
VAKTIVPLCLPSCAETGKVYDFRTGKFQEFRAPNLAALGGWNFFVA